MSRYCRNLARQRTISHIREHHPSPWRLDVPVDLGFRQFGSYHQLWWGWTSPVSLLRNVLPQITQLVRCGDKFPSLCSSQYFMRHFLWEWVTCSIILKQHCYGMSFQIFAAWMVSMFFLKHLCEVTNNGSWESRTVFPRVSSLWIPVMWDVPWKKKGSVVKRIWVTLYFMPLLGELQHTLLYYRLWGDT